MTEETKVLTQRLITTAAHAELTATRLDAGRYMDWFDINGDQHHDGHIKTFLLEYAKIMNEAAEFLTEQS